MRPVASRCFSEQTSPEDEMRFLVLKPGSDMDTAQVQGLPMGVKTRLWPGRDWSGEGGGGG